MEKYEQVARQLRLIKEGQQNTMICLGSLDRPVVQERVNNYFNVLKN